MIIECLEMTHTLGNTHASECIPWRHKFIMSTSEFLFLGLGWRNSGKLAEMWFLYFCPFSVLVCLLTGDCGYNKKSIVFQTILSLLACSRYRKRLFLEWWLGSLCCWLSQMNSLNFLKFSLCLYMATPWNLFSKDGMVY